MFFIYILKIPRSKLQSAQADLTDWTWFLPYGRRPLVNRPCRRHVILAWV